jgi:hypothetical protein
MTHWHTLARLSFVILSLSVGACSATHTAPDAALPDAAPVDGDIPDAGPRDVCDPEDARRDPCPAALCDGPSRWHWDGEACVELDCGACVGADCATTGADSLAECEEAHAACKPQRCRATGGEWAWWAEACGDYRCGLPPPQVCLVGAPACNCGSGRSYDADAGCVADPMCALVDPLPPDVLCARTGGTWAATCCSSVCGVACELDCAAMACSCGPLEIFDGA